MFISVIKLIDNSYLHFGPFPDYESADKFGREKFNEYALGKCAYVEGLIAPVLIPERRV